MTSAGSSTTSTTLWATSASRRSGSPTCASRRSSGSRPAAASRCCTGSARWIRRGWFPPIASEVTYANREVVIGPDQVVERRLRGLLPADLRLCVQGEARADRLRQLSQAGGGYLEEDR